MISSDSTPADRDVAVAAGANVMVAIGAERDAADAIRRLSRAERGADATSDDGTNGRFLPGLSGS